MITSNRKQKRRLGAATLELAFVAIPVFMVVFGIFEYGRLLMDWTVLNAAAREGCRYALVNNTNSTIATDVQAVVTARLGKETASFKSVTVTLTGTHNGTATAITNLMAGDPIAVSVSGPYRFMNIIPLIPMPSVTLSSSCTSICEGGN
jgi:Flp pilus assembly protein TadG